MSNPPLRCRLFGHRYDHVYAYGAESLGVVVVICKRRHCGHIIRTYTETDVTTYSDGFGHKPTEPAPLDLTDDEAEAFIAGMQAQGRMVPPQPTEQESR